MQPGAHLAEVVVSRWLNFSSSDTQTAARVELVWEQTISLWMITMWVRFGSVQFSSRWYLCARKSPYALHSVSQKVCQCHLWNGSNVRLIDDGPLSSFQGRSSSASSFHASLLQAIDGVMSLALYPQAVSQAPQHFRSSEKQAIYEGFFTRKSICSIISRYSGMSRALHSLLYLKVDVDHWHISISASHSTLHFL